MEESGRLLLTLKLKDKLQHIKTDKNKKKFLLNCISSHNLVVQKIEELLSDFIPQDIEYANFQCQQCQSNDFVKDNYQYICNQCGTLKESQSSGKTYEKFEYINPGDNNVTAIIGGKKVTFDLNKINTWIGEKDPLAKSTQKIIDVLEAIYSIQGREISRDVQNTAIRLWYNFNTLYTSLKFETSYKTNAILALCIFFAFKMNNEKISLEEISNKLNISVTIIHQNHALFANVFQNTNYFANVSILVTRCEISLKHKVKVVLNMIKAHMKQYYPEPITSAQYAGIVYYITQNITKSKEYTLEYLQSVCNVSPPTISKISKEVMNFYSKNKNLYTKLFF